MIARARLFALALVAVVPPHHVNAQSIAPVSLKPPSATLTEEFSQIVALRELADGRVLIGDRREERVVVADFARNTVSQISRTGMGPTEYPTVRTLLRLGGDSSLMVDVMSRRWLVFAGARASGLFATASPGWQAAKGRILGADTVGYLLADVDERLPMYGIVMHDSVALLRINARTGAIDTIARVRALPARFEITDGSGTRRTVRTVPVLGVGEASLLHGDGWLSIARLSPYRVDWRSPDGTWTRGAPLPFREIAFEGDERDAYLRRYEAMTGRNWTPSSLVTWAASIPPFEREPLYAVPDGSVAIARTPTANDPSNRYDIVDRRGRLLAQVVLLPSDRIIGFGRSSVYAVTVRDDGIELVRRHPWP